MPSMPVITAASPAARVAVSGVRRRLWPTLGAAAVLWGAFAIYVFLHSPLRDIAARLAGRPGHLSYFSTVAAVSPGAVLASLMAILAIAAALVAAASLARGFGAAAERPLVFGVVAYAFVVVPAAVIGVVGGLLGAAPLRPPLGPALVAVPALATALWQVRRGWRPRLPQIRLRYVTSGPVLMMAMLAAVLIGASTFVAVTRPPSGFDALAYHAPMSVAFWRDGNIVDLLTRAPERSFAMAWPGAAELWFGLLLIAGGERLANIGQLPFALLGGVAVYAFARRLRVPRGPAAIAALSYLLMPIVVLQAGVQLNDVVATTLLAAAVVLLFSAPERWTAARLVVAGLALGLATATKVSALPSLTGLLLFTSAAMLTTEHAARHRTVRRLAWIALGFSIAVAPWWLRNGTFYGNPTYPVAIPLISRGLSAGVAADIGRLDDRFVPTPAAWPLYPLLEAHSEQSGFGPLWLLAGVPGIIGAVLLRRRRGAVVLFGTVVACTVAAWVVFTSHQPRHLLLIPTLGFAFAPFALSLVPRSMRSSIVGLWLTAAVFSVLVTFDQAILPRVQEPPDRAAFYDEVWGVDPVVAADTRVGSLLYNMGFASLAYAGDYPLLGPSLDRRLFPASPDDTTGEIVALMRRFSVQYAYVPTSPENEQEVRGRYPPELFALERESIVTRGERAGTRRYLFRLRDAAPSQGLTPLPGPAGQLAARPR